MAEVERCAQGHPMLRCPSPYQDIPFCPTCAREIRERATDAPLLTPAEHRLTTLLGEAFTIYAREVVGHGETRHGDLEEFAAGVHVLQHAVMAQAAARAYPDLYRLAGEVIAEERG